MENFASNLQVGSIIMLIGMGVVFAFLVIMVYVMDITAVIIKKFNEIFPEEVKEQTTKKKTKTDDSEIALAIAIAHAQQRRA